MFALLAFGAFSLAPHTLGLASPFWNQWYGWMDRLERLGFFSLFFFFLRFGPIDWEKRMQQF